MNSNRTHQTTLHTLQTGDKVAYSTQFLNNIGESHGRMATARGVVTAREVVNPEFILIAVDWKGMPLPGQVNEANLAKVGLNTRFSNC